jgi:Flp pilus assembly pilin Flp
MFSSYLNKRIKKGQGLVEYALILVLVAIIVIATLLVLGPKVGNTFSKVNSSLSGVGGAGGSAPATQVAQPTQVPTWKNCANEGGFCSFSGTAPVRYGANGHYATGTYTNGVSCSNSVFGDPIFGTPKTCQYFQ